MSGEGDETDRMSVQVQLEGINTSPSDTQPVRTTVTIAAESEVQESQNCESPSDVVPTCISKRLRLLASRATAAIAALITVVAIVSLQSIVDVNMLSMESLLQSVKADIDGLMASTVRPY
jgi:hypothetical protein